MENANCIPLREPFQRYLYFSSASATSQRQGRKQRRSRAIVLELLFLFFSLFRIQRAVRVTVAWQ